MPVDVLVLNVGSSSLKAALLELEPDGLSQRQPQPARLWDGQVALAGQEALAERLENWLEPALEPWWPRVACVGHRVVPTPCRSTR